MAAFNYKHLWYFWMVAREGSIAAATVKLGVSQPAVSSQIQRLERSLGMKLLEKSGRGRALTPAGTTVYAYADEIFRLGHEMQETLEHGGRRPLALTVGVAEGLPPTLTHRLLAPALGLPRPVRLAVRHGPLARLSAELGARELDVVLSAERLPAGSPVRAQAHPLGRCGITLLATAEVAGERAGRFPASLDGASFVMPPVDSALRRSLDAWLQAVGVVPTVVAELDDWTSRLLLARSAAGVTAAPTAVAAELGARHALQALGEAPDAVQHFYALTVERRPRHPGVVAVIDAARTDPIR
ncbi:MAG TPA: LysR family transcriptional regulator [Longimicrobium sp.]